MVIALLTDFGTSDHFVASMKAVILSINPAATIVDITHNIEPQDIHSAAFTLSACFRDFPPGTIFVVVVDPGVGSERRAIAATSGGYSFVAPDNGVISFALDEDAEIFSLTNEKYFTRNISNTFHGRDIFAPVAAHLSNGVDPAEFGKKINDPVRLKFPKPHKMPDGETIAQVIHIDHFGNLITNLRREDLRVNFHLELGSHRIVQRCEFYSQAGAGELFSIFGSTGFLEIAVNRGSARDLLAIQVGDKITVRP